MREVDRIITNGKIVTFNAGDEILEKGAVAISGTRIVDVGETEKILSEFHAKDTIDASHHLVMPGLINAHAHAPMTLFRGLADDIPLIPWLDEMQRATLMVNNRDDMKTGAVLGYAEQLMGGITTTLDMYFFPEVLAEAAKQTGIRLITGPVFVSSPDVDGIEAANRSRYGEEFIRKYKDDGQIIPCVSPHSPLDIPVETLQEAMALAERHDVLLTIHCAETQDEVSRVQAQTGKRPLALLYDFGLMSKRTVLAHCVYLTEDEIRMLAESGAVVAHCPLSNLKLADGIAPVPAMLEAGIPVVFGTDGAGSSNDLDLWKVIRLAATLHKATSLDPTVFPAKAVLQQATIGAAKALGLERRIGSLEKGKLADLILIDLNQPHLVPVYDTYSLLAYAVGRGDVETVIVGGQVVLREHRFEKLHLAPVIRNARKIADRIKAS